MKQIFKEAELDGLEVTCDDCQWKGKGSALNQIDLYGVTKYPELHCPECDAFIANLEPTQGPDGESADQFSFQVG